MAGYIGSGGVFADDLQFATPTYAKNDHGLRSDLYRDTLCRVFVRVEDAEWDLFSRSIADPHVARPAFLAAIAGNPRLQRGYVDFLVNAATLNFRELMQVGQALGGSHIVYCFDQEPVQVPIGGMLLNTRQDDQATNFVRIYLELLRASVAARRQKVVSLRIDAFILTGVFTQLSLQYEGRTEVGVPFQSAFLVKRLAIVDYTRSWLPTRVGTPFTEDLNAVPTDTIIASDRGIVTVRGRLAADLVRDSAADNREQRQVRQTPPAPPTAQEEAVGRAEARLEASREALARIEAEMEVRNRAVAAAVNDNAALARASEASRETLGRLGAMRAEVAARESEVTRLREDNNMVTVTSEPAPLPPAARSDAQPETTPPRAT